MEDDESDLYGPSITTAPVTNGAVKVEAEDHKQEDALEDVEDGEEEDDSDSVRPSLLI